MKKNGSKVHLLCAGRWYGGTSRITHVWNGKKFIPLLECPKSAAWYGKRTPKEAQVFNRAPEGDREWRKYCKWPKGVTWAQCWTPLEIENCGIAVTGPSGAY